MALQKTITTENGLDLSYWRITNATQHFEGEGHQFNFVLQGSKDADYRAKGSAPLTFNFRPILNYTGHVDSWDAVSNNVLQPNSGDLRPALYNWIKTLNWYRLVFSFKRLRSAAQLLGNISHP